MTQQIATRTNVEQVCHTIAKPDFKSKIAQALPPGLDPDRFVRVTLTAIQQNPAIANAERQSLYNSVIRCAQDGLLPDGKRAALVMFGDKAQYMPMIGGLRQILAEHGIAMATGVVHKNDSFEYQLGVEPTMRHIPAPLDQPRGDAIGAWAQAKDADGNLYLEVMGKEDIEKVRAVSRARNGDLWSKWWGEAARKTVGRRLFKSLPLADKLDERETRILDAMDSEIDFTTPPAADASESTPAAASGARRPRGLAGVAAAGEAASGAQDADAIDADYREVEPDAAPAAGPSDDPRSVDDVSHF